jgi:hypothetical protein
VTSPGQRFVNSSQQLSSFQIDHTPSTNFWDVVNLSLKLLREGNNKTRRGLIKVIRTYLKNKGGKAELKHRWSYENAKLSLTKGGC